MNENSPLASVNFVQPPSPQPVAGQADEGDLHARGRRVVAVDHLAVHGGQADHRDGHLHDVAVEARSVHTLPAFAEACAFAAIW